MLSLATKALRDELNKFFPELKGRIYSNWPGLEKQEVYPYIVVFSNRASIERLEYEEIGAMEDGSTLFSTGYWDVRIDVNYLSKEGLLSDQESLVDKISDFFNIQLTKPPLRPSEVSRDILYHVGKYLITANVVLNNINLIQDGVDIKRGDRRSIAELSMHAPRLKIEKPQRWKSYKIEAEVSE